jgi:hypothetical protein
MNFVLLLRNTAKSKEYVKIYCSTNMLRYDLRLKMMFGSSLPPVVCRRAHVLFTLFVFARV